MDSYVGRAERLNDTLMVVTFDTATGKVAMVSVPRDTAGFPYYWGGDAPATMKINSLVTYVSNGWVKSPDEPMTTLVNEVGYLIGIPVNYYATLDLASFMKLIDKVGGVDINNPSAINDLDLRLARRHRPGLLRSRPASTISTAVTRSRTSALDTATTTVTGPVPRGSKRFWSRWSTRLRAREMPSPCPASCSWRAP